MSAPIPSVPSTTVLARSRRPGVADTVVHVRPRVVGDRAGQRAIEQHAMHDQPVVCCQHLEPGRGGVVLGTLGDVDVHADPEVGGEPRGRLQRVVGAREGGVDADQPAPAGAQEPGVLLEPTPSAVRSVAVGDSIGAHHSHPDLGARFGDHVEASLDGVRALVVVDDRGRPRHQCFRGAEQGTGADHVVIEGVIEPPPHLFQDLAETGRLPRRRRHPAGQRRVQVMVTTHHARRRVRHLSNTRHLARPLRLGAWDRSPTNRAATTVPLLDETIPHNLLRAIEEHEYREALVSRHQQIRWTYFEFGERVARPGQEPHARSGSRRATGSASGAPNYAEWTLVQYATAEIGVILVNLNPAYRTHELAYALHQSGCRWIYRRPRVQVVELRRRWSTRSAEQCPALERAVFFWTDEWNDLIDGDELVSRRASSPSAASSLHPDDPINIQYTSGTTGFPKGATLTHRNILNNGYFTTELQGFTPGDRLCIPVPFYHCFGMVMGNLGCTSHGATMVIPSDAFDPTARARDGRGRALHGAVRRADDVHRRARPPRLRPSSTCRRCAPA